MAALAAGTTIVTANNRAAGWLRDRYDRVQITTGRTVWPSPKVMPWNAWLRTMWKQLRGASPSLRLQLLSPWQEARLWQRVIAANPEYAGLHAANAAALAASAWEVAHGWRGAWAQWGGPTARDEHRAFVDWAGRFARECAANDWIDAARLPLLLIDGLASGALAGAEPCRPDEGRYPSSSLRIGLFGFADLTPQQQALVDALVAAGGQVTRFDSAHASPPTDARPHARRVRCADPVDEWRLCAQWCREQLARAPETEIGVVIPDLAAQRPQVERVFADVLAPGAVLAAQPVAPPFNISQSDPIAAQPLVDIALTLLGWHEAPAGPVAVAALCRSPYVAGHEAEWPERAQLVLALAAAPRESWRAGELARFAGGRCPVLAGSLRAFETATGDFRKRRDARAWRQAWDDALTAAGWLVAARLDSAEFQARAAWNELLDEWMRAESIAGSLRHADALSSLQRLAGETAFQAERPPARTQILGTLEAAGLRFDALWICGLTAERWPAAPQPSPLLPLAWQRMVQAPHASAERELRYHRALTAQFAAAARDVVFSWPATIDGIPATPSALLLDFAAVESTDLVGEREPALSARMLEARGLQHWEDTNGVPLPAVGARARVGILEAQAACPFQAYAGARLRAEPWPRRTIGLTPAERGTLLHTVLAAFWQGLAGQDALLDLDSETWRARCEGAVDGALGEVPAERWHLLGDAIRALEHERLLKLLQQWLEIEAERPPFAVVERETQRTLTIDGLELRLRIDRIDRLGDNQLLVIDYKTGKSGIADLYREERLLAPQLPMYAEALAPEAVGAVAYATVRCGENRVMGISATQGEWLALKPADPDWPAVRGRWRRQIEALVAEYRAGAATVAPWSYPNTCKNCARHALCRINEHMATIAQLEDIPALDDGEDA